MTQKHWMILAAAWLLVFAGFYFLVWRPNTGDIKRTQKLIRIKEQQLAQLIRDVQAWPATVTRAKMDQYEQRLSHLFSLVPAAEEVPQLLEQIEKRGVRKAHLTFVSLEHQLRSDQEQRPAVLAANVQSQTNPTAGTGGAHASQKESYTLTVEGSYANVVQFIKDLEVAPRLINVNTFQIKRLEGTDRVQATLTLNIFYTGNSS